MLANVFISSLCVSGKGKVGVMFLVLLLVPGGKLMVGVFNQLGYSVILVSLTSHKVRLESKDAGRLCLGSLSSFTEFQTLNIVAAKQSFDFKREREQKRQRKREREADT